MQTRLHVIYTCSRVALEIQSSFIPVHRLGSVGVLRGLVVYLRGASLEI